MTTSGPSSGHTLPSRLKRPSRGLAWGRFLTQTDRQSDIRPRFSGPTRDQETFATRELSGGQEGVDMSEPTYDDRVLALEEELGIPTSDAQAMIDAEDVLAQRRG